MWWACYVSTVTILLWIDKPQFDVRFYHTMPFVSSRCQEQKENRKNIKIKAAEK